METTVMGSIGYILELIWIYIGLMEKGETMIQGCGV